VKRKQIVPEAKYETNLSTLDDKRKNSNMRKGKRLLLQDDINLALRLNPSPSPHAHTPKFNFVKKNQGGASYNSKDLRTGNFEESVWHSQQTPTAKYAVQWNSQERKITSPAYKKAIRPGYDVACFLQVKDPPTKLISPATYNGLDAYRSTQTKKF